ncbi:MAG: motility protein A [Planctomycetota bacterium]
MTNNVSVGLIDCWYALFESAQMDIATIIGLLAGFGLIFASIAMGGGSGLSAFIDVPSLMITVGGSIAALLINFPLKVCLSSMSVIKKCFISKLPEATELISRFKQLAVIVRKDGLLALEAELETIDDDFLKRGLEMVIGGAEEDQVQNVLEVELASIEQRHTTGKKIVESTGAAAPAFGMIGTLVGLVQMLQSLDDPSKIGGGMAVALLTTLYGAIIANVACIPLAGKLETRSQEEVACRELMITGIVALAKGLSPPAVEDALVAYISPKSRRSLQAEAEAG